MFLPDFVCLSVSQQDNSKSSGWIFLKFSGNVGNGKFWGWSERNPGFWIALKFSETAVKPNMMMPPGEQHGLGGGLRALTAF